MILKTSNKCVWCFLIIKNIYTLKVYTLYVEIKSSIKEISFGQNKLHKKCILLIRNSCTSRNTKLKNWRVTRRLFDSLNPFLDSKPFWKSCNPSLSKKHSFGDKANYRPVSVLPFISKVLEKIIYDLLYEYLETFLSELLCGFRKAHSTQHALFRLIQKWQSELDSGGYVGTILMGLSKAYDCLSHDLLIAKLKAYGLDVDSLNFLLDYLSLRKHRTKERSSYSKWSEICWGIPQGPILGPLLFNIFINDIFFFRRKIKNL